MPYLEYRESDGYVVAVHEERPEEAEEGYAVAESDHFKLGDEFEYYIKVYVNEIKDGRVTSHAAVRQGPPQQEILKEIDKLRRGTGTGRDVEKGVSTRLDEIEERLSRLEEVR